MKLIGLSGPKRSGKDTIAQMLVEERGFVKYSLATPIKQMLLDLDPFVDGPTSLARFLDSLDGDWDAASARTTSRSSSRTVASVPRPGS